MTLGNLARYGLRYALIYVAILVVLILASLLVERLTGVVLGNLSIGALIGAPMLTYERFLKDNDRLLDRREYWSLVLSGTAIAVLLDIVPSFLLIYVTHGNVGVDRQFVILVLGFVLAKSLLANMVFYSSFLGSRLLERVRRKRGRHV